MNYTIIQVLPRVTGTSKSGNSWEKQDVIVQTHDEKYPKKICIELFNKPDLILQVGEIWNINFGVESREYNGRWFTSVRWISGTLQQGIGVREPVSLMDGAPDLSQDDESDLPFSLG